MTFMRIALRWSPVRAQAGAHMHTHSYATHTHALHKVSAETSSLHNTANSWELYFTAWHKKKPSCKQTHKHTHKSLRVTKLRYSVHILSSSCFAMWVSLFLLFILIISVATQTNHKVIRQYFGYLFCCTFFYFLFSENVVTDVHYTQFWVWSQFK